MKLGVLSCSILSKEASLKASRPATTRMCCCLPVIILLISSADIEEIEASQRPRAPDVDDDDFPLPPTRKRKEILFSNEVCVTT
jgi:hypothetical protein